MTYGTAQVQHRTCTHESICSWLNNCQEQGSGTCFTCEYPSFSNSRKQNGCYTLFLDDDSIMSKFTHTSKCNIVFGQYHIRSKESITQMCNLLKCTWTTIWTTVPHMFVLYCTSLIDQFPIWLLMMCNKSEMVHLYMPSRTIWYQYSGLIQNIKLGEGDKVNRFDF